jgi:5-methylcytosine-specific restriction endonuclease McrA
MFRKDAYGNIICFADYGTDSECGWHVDHIVPQSKGGSDMLSNLQPLHWKTNISLHNIEQGKKYIKTYNTRSCPDPSSVGKQLL